jgi:predicted metalloendopeptidase
MLERIEALETLEDMQDLIVDLVVWDLPHFLNLDVSVGVRKHGTHLLFIQGGGIVLPDPGYYDILYNGTYDDDEKEDREQMRHYFKTLNKLTGLSDHDAEGSSLPAPLSPSSFLLPSS